MTNKLNILYHHRTQGRGAEGVHIASIVNALEAQGHTVTVLSPPGINPLSEAGNAPVDKSEVNTRGIKSLWKIISKYMPNILFEFIEIIYNMPASIQLEKKLRQEKFDLIYERYAFYMFAGARKAKKYHIPFVLEANEVNGIKDRARKQSMPVICGMFEKYIFNRCTSILTVSSYLKNMIMAQGVSDNKVIVTPNAVDINKFSKKLDNTALKKELNLNDKVVIGFAGWFDHWDRLDLLYKTFKELKEKNPDLALLLVGDGQVLDEIRQQQKINKIPDVILTGAVPRDTVHMYISLLDIAVITHSNEFGSPVVMFEFMGLGIPVIAPKLLPVTDVLQHDETALIFNVLDMESMQSELQKMLDSRELRDKISSAAHKKLLEDHTWDMNAKTILTSAGFP